MGHSRIGTLPRTRAWKEVIKLITDGADVADIADATMRAADRAFEKIQRDSGFADAVDLMTHIAIAARQNDPRQYLESIGVTLPDNATIADIAVSMTGALDARAANRGEASTFSELAHSALVSSIVQQLDEIFGTMIPPSADEIQRALGRFGTEKEFGKLSRQFFATLTFNSLDYFLSHTVGAQVGEGKAFATTNQVGQFTDALELHCKEASEIVEKFSGEWFSKYFHLGSGSIPRRKAEAFGWGAIQKMRKEMNVRGKIK